MPKGTSAVARCFGTLTLVDLPVPKPSLSQQPELSCHPQLDIVMRRLYWRANEGGTGFNVININTTTIGPLQSGVQTVAEGWSCCCMCHCVFGGVFWKMTADLCVVAAAAMCHAPSPSHRWHTSRRYRPAQTTTHFNQSLSMDCAWAMFTHLSYLGLSVCVRLPPLQPLPQPKPLTPQAD